MNSSDFYFVFYKHVEAPRQRGIKYKGDTVYGYWFLDSPGIMETKLNNAIIFHVGLANDRKGSRYKFLISPKSIEISAEKFGISPVYLFINNEEIHISSSIKILVEKLVPEYELNISKRFILEQNLFNYSLFDNTIYSEIKILPSESKAIITDHLQFENAPGIEDCFTENPIPYNKCINNLIDLFISLNSSKIKDGDYISFTSGFDGRSLVALAKYLKKDFSTYSFGTEKNEDLFLPRGQAEDLGYNFFPINLDSEEYYYEFWNLGKDIIRKSGGTTNFLQVHWAYSAKLLSQKTNTLISGIFGSELFRAAHIAGQFTSPVLVDYFKNIETDEWITKIKTAKSFRFLNQENFTNELDDLIDELSVYKNKIINLNSNQRFYKYIFGEVFRKYFGMQYLFPQQDYLKMISPFLDFDFVKELLKTKFAGVNNEFFTHNPLKRLKGQLFYAELINRICPELSNLSTGKGYRPGDLLSFSGKTNIAYHYFKKHLKRKAVRTNLDNLGIISAYGANKKMFDNVKINQDLFNENLVNSLRTSGAWKTEILLRDKFIEALSLNVYINEN